MPLFNLSEILHVTSLCAVRQVYDWASIGLLMPALAASRYSQDRQFGWHFDRVRRALQLGQADVFFDQFGRCVGHVLWTQLQPTLEAEVLRLGPNAISDTQFGVHGQAYVLDFASRFGETLNVYAAMRDRTFASIPELTYFHVKRNQRIAKRLSRSDCYSFLRPRSTHMPRETLLRHGDYADLLHAATSKLEDAIELGQSLTIMRTDESFARLPVAAALSRVKVPLDAKQARVYEDAQSNPIAFVSWAWFDPESLVSQPLVPVQHLPPHRWNEGRCLFLCDATALSNGRDAVIADLAGSWFGNEDLYLYPEQESPGKASIPKLWSRGQRALMSELASQGSISNLVYRSLCEIPGPQ